MGGPAAAGDGDVLLSPELLAAAGGCLGQPWKAASPRQGVPQWEAVCCLGRIWGLPQIP